MKRLILIALTLFPLSCFDGLGTMFDDLTMKVPLCVAPGGSDLNDGRGWGNAKATIQAAVSSASDDDEIWVAAGTYIVHDTGSDVIEINRSVSLFGGFSGNESRKNERNINNNITRIEADGATRLVAISSASGVVLDGFTLSGGYTAQAAIHIDQSSSVLIKGCVFNSGYTRVSHTASSVEYQGCRFLSTESDQEGGAIQSNGSTIVIKNSLFDGCQSSSDGGALYAINSTVTISGNTRFFRNTSVGGGGAICVDSSTLNISGCHIGGEDSGSGNSAGYQGGALFMVSSTAVVSDSFIRKNSSVASGGGILSTLSLLTLINTEVSANHAGINGIGGGISFNSANQDGFLDITNCGFYDNYAGGSSNAGGGAISFFSGSTANVILKLTGTVFDHNYSSGSTTSSAIYFDSSGPENRIVMDSCIVRNTPTDVAPAVRVNSGTGNRIINSLFYGNKAVSSTAYGGAMYLSASSLLVNCTFWDNSSANGGAVFLSGAAPYHVYNTVFYNNADSNAGTGTDNLNTGSNVTLNRYNCFYNGGVSAYNDVDGGGCINSSSDPFLSVTPGNAGFMRPNSLLADSGYTGAISGFTMPSTDLAGNTRVRGGAVDIGAYEAQ